MSTQASSSLREEETNSKDSLRRKIELSNQSLLDRHLSEVLKSYNTFIEGIASEAYKTPELISNPVLSRNPFSNELLLRMLKHKALGEEKGFKFRKFSLSTLTAIASYLVKNFAFLFLLPVYFLVYRFSKLPSKFKSVSSERKLFIVDTFTMIDRIFPAKAFHETYFDGLYEELERSEKDFGTQYRILCMLIGDRPLNFKRRLETYNILSQDGRNFITEFDLLKFSDYLDLLRFLWVYLFKSLGLLQLNSDSIESELFKDEVIRSLSKVQTFAYVRYLVGRRIGRLSNTGVEIISWYENQARDMLFIRGLRDSGGAVYFNGCQFFYQLPSWAHLEPLEIQVERKAAPDRILVSGPYYLKSKKNLPYIVGMLPRSEIINKSAEEFEDINSRKEGLVLLTYDISESHRLVGIASKVLKDFPGTVNVKLHPNHLLHDPGYLIPPAWNKIEKPLPELCKKSSFVVSSGTSAALDAACMGCSVLIIGSVDSITHNVMPEIGKGEIWEVAFDSKEGVELLNRLNSIRRASPRRISEIASELRSELIAPTSGNRYQEIFRLGSREFRMP